jgi:RNA polymerase sigma-70 factor (ECF subfamily)
VPWGGPISACRAGPFSADRHQTTAVARGNPLERRQLVRPRCPWSARGGDAIAAPPARRDKVSVQELATRSDPTPEALLAAFRGGDVAAMGALFDMTAPELFRVALALTPDAASAEDALQETYLVLLAHAAKWDPSRRVAPWLTGILRLKLHEVRRSRREPDPHRLTLLPPEADASVRVSVHEEQERVREQIEALPEAFRAIALMRWQYGLEPAEIAHIRGEPPGTTRSLLSRALDRLRATMKGLPAFSFGPRPSRGLPAVRDAILSSAKTQLVTASAVTGTTGGAIMAGKAWVVAASAAAMFGGAAAWWAGAGRHEQASTTTSPTAVSGVDPNASEARADPALAPNGSRAAARIAALENEVAQLKARLAPFEGMDPVDILLHAHFGISERLRAIAALPEDKRAMVAWRLGREWNEHAEHATELLAELGAESDVGALRVLSEVLRAGGIDDPSSDAVMQARAILKDGNPVERRLAAVRLLQQTGVGNRSRAAGFTPEVRAAFLDAAKSESASEVLGALAEPPGGPTADLLSALDARLSQVTEHGPRREILQAIAWQTFERDHGEAMWQRWASAVSPDERDDYAYALAMTANRKSWFAPESEQLNAHRTLWRDRLSQMIRASSDLKTRQWLARSTQYGMNLGLSGDDGATWVRALAAAEPDAAQRRRLEEWATALASGKPYEFDFSK